MQGSVTHERIHSAALVPVVWGKEEPGSRGTFSQKVNSLFGLIDRGENAPPPPPPPDLPAYGLALRDVPHTKPCRTGRGQWHRKQTTEPRRGPPRPKIRCAPYRRRRNATTALRPQTINRRNRRLLVSADRYRRASFAGALRTPAGAATANRPTTSTAVRSQTAVPNTAAQAVPRLTGGAPALPSAITTSRRRGASDGADRAHRR